MLVLPPSIACPLPNLTIEWYLSGMGRDGPEIWKKSLSLWTCRLRTKISKNLTVKSKWKYLEAKFFFTLILPLKFENCHTHISLKVCFLGELVADIWEVDEFCIQEQVKIAENLSLRLIYQNIFSEQTEWRQNECGFYYFVFIWRM